MLTLYLVRHAENQANLTKEFSYRRVDYSLTPKGRLQARQTADHLREVQIDAIYSSPLKRALETAAQIAQVKDLEIDFSEDLREINVGDLEEMHGSPESWELYRQVLMAWRRGQWKTGFPGGENYLELQTRIRRFFQLLLERHTRGGVLVVGHGGLFNLSLPELCTSTNLDGLLQRPIHNCSISEFQWQGAAYINQGQLVRWATTDHLKGEAAELVPGIPD